MKKETYKVTHPTIKEISIGDKFICKDGDIVEFDHYDRYNINRPIVMKIVSNKKQGTTSSLYFDHLLRHNSNHWSNNVKYIERIYIPLKDKLNLF